MKLAETRYDNRETGCCARLDTSRWDHAKHAWNEKPFLKDHVREFLHVPINFGSVMSRDHRVIEEAGAYPEEPIWLSDEISPWGSDIFVATDRLVPGATMETLSGVFLTRVFEGPYRDMRKWIREMETYVRDEGGALEHLYFFYPYCPKCAHAFGKNEVVLFAKVA